MDTEWYLSIKFAQIGEANVIFEELSQVSKLTINMASTEDH